MEGRRGNLVLRQAQNERRKGKLRMSGMAKCRGGLLSPPTPRLFVIASPDGIGVFRIQILGFGVCLGLVILSNRHCLKRGCPECPAYSS